MLKVDRWEVFYADGSTFASEQGSWAECPALGVTAVVWYQPGGVMLEEAGNDTDVVTYIGDAEGCDYPVKMPLWTDGESYWRVHDLAKRSFAPEVSHGNHS